VADEDHFGAWSQHFISWLKQQRARDNIYPKRRILDKDNPKPKVCSVCSCEYILPPCAFLVTVAGLLPFCIGQLHRWRRAKASSQGSLAGFCVGWFEPARNVAQVEPLGVHPRFHQLGLGRVLLLEMLRRFKEHGAESAFVETDLDRTPARRAYQAVGFQQVHTIRRKGKWLN
jgi:ribosomal protein S18 acetylase RimI-like enzyme